MPRTNGVIEPLLQILDELAGEVSPAKTGPTISDSILSKLLAAEIKTLPEGREQKSAAFRAYFDQNPQMEEWLKKLLSTVAGRKNLKALLRMENIPLA